eukprot:Colp12_sorted_trinity150504_noHs@26976
MGVSAKDKRKAAKAAKAPASKTKTVEDTEQVQNQLKVSERNCTGVLASRPASRDIKIEGFSLSYFGKELISDTIIELNYGRRYGLLGANGSGKTTFLEVLANREVPIPDHIDMYLLRTEVPPSDRTALQAVVDIVEGEIRRLEKEEQRLLEEEGPDSEALHDVYERLELLDPNTLEARAADILTGLGFTHKQQLKFTKDLSGGWRMRVALARALLVRPTLLLLDEPTNHLDLEACVWLEDYLKTYPRILVIVSHSQDFLNGVCTNMMVLRLQKLTYWTGNYDQYQKTREELEVQQMKQYEKQQEEIKHMKEFIASCGTYSNLVRQAKSRQKVIDKMEAAGLIEKVVQDKKLQFFFPQCGALTSPIIVFNDVSFAYSGKKEEYLYTHLEFGIHMDSRIALVGPNGAGKSTLLKLMVGELTPSEGMIRINSHLQFARYNQHSAEQLDDTLCPLDAMKKEFAAENLDTDEWRRWLGRYGITGKAQTEPIGTLSDGLKSRIVFAFIAKRNPHMLLLDEPTNHLDMECIDSLAEAINDFNGPMILVSHDFRLIDQVAKEIWICQDRTITRWDGSIREYKEELRKMMAAAKERS